jgi:hydroxymethylglutaryl-CoA lyase
MFMDVHRSGFVDRDCGQEGMTVTVVVEVGPRDGLQNEDRTLPVGRRARFIDELSTTGLTRIEAVSFVHPRAVPQMAGTEEVLERVTRRPDVSLAGLALNARGVERALAAGVDECNLIVVATNEFSQRNQGMTTQHSLDELPALVSQVRAAGVFATVTVGASFGCPFEGEVSLDRLTTVMEGVLAAQPDELALADTIGVAVPGDIRRAVDRARSLTDLPLRLHLHNTRNTGYANAAAAIDLGVAALDASTGGLGGCPFAPSATGNIATEDLHYLLERSGQEPTYDRAAVVRAGHAISADLQVTVPALLGHAGGFPVPSGELR